MDNFRTTYQAADMTHRFPFFPFIVFATGPVENSIMPSLPALRACFILQNNYDAFTKLHIDKSSFYGVVSSYWTRRQSLVQWLTSLPMKNKTERSHNTYPCIINYYIIRTTLSILLFIHSFCCLCSFGFIRMPHDQHNYIRHCIINSYTYVFSLMTAISDSFLVWMASFVHTS